MIYNPGQLTMGMGLGMRLVERILDMQRRRDFLRYKRNKLESLISEANNANNNNSNKRNRHR